MGEVIDFQSAKKKRDALGKDPVADEKGVLAERTKYWDLAMGNVSKTYKDKKITYKNEEGDTVSEKFEASPLEMKIVAKQIANRETIGFKYETLMHELVKDVDESKLEKETEEGAHKYLSEAAKILEHPHIREGVSMQEFYGSMMEIAQRLQIPERRMKVLLKQAQKNNSKGKDARKALIQYMTMTAQDHYVRSSDQYLTKDIKDNDIKSMTKYKHAVAAAAEAISHGRYRPNLANIATIEDARGILKDTSESYLSDRDQPHAKNRDTSLYSSKPKKDTKKAA